MHQLSGAKVSTNQPFKKLPLKIDLRENLGLMPKVVGEVDEESVASEAAHLLPIPKHPLPPMPEPARICGPVKAYNPPTPPQHTLAPKNPQDNRTPQRRQCWRCQKWGHLAAKCRTVMPRHQPYPPPQGPQVPIGPGGKGPGDGIRFKFLEASE